SSCTRSSRVSTRRTAPSTSPTSSCGPGGVDPMRLSVMRPKFVVLAVLALSFALAGCFGPPIPPATGGTSDLIPCPAAADVHVVTANAELDPSCRSTGRFQITAGNVRFDCNGALVTGSGGTGIEVSTPADVSMEGVRIQDCRTDGFVNGIRVTR